MGEGVFVCEEGFDEIDVAVIRRLGTDLMVGRGLLPVGSCREGEERREEEEEESDVMVP